MRLLFPETLWSACRKTAAGITLGAAACMLFAISAASLPAVASAAGADTVITADTLEYFAGEKKYRGRGAVTVRQEGLTIEADEMVYLEEGDMVTMSGNVRYDDPKTSFTAKQAEMHMAKKTGSLRDAHIFFKKSHYYLDGAVIEQTSENEFISPEEASVTTCDGPAAAWCIRGKDMKLQMGDKLTGRDTSLRFGDLPVFYTPYLWAPVSNDRKTGFLVPTVSSSHSRGFGISVPFYWAIAENRDATVILDSYSRKGLGTGLEYRFIEPRGLQSAWWFYHLRDEGLDKDFMEFRVLHDNRAAGGIGLFVNANLVNEKAFYRDTAFHKDFYREISPDFEKNLQRVLETTAEVNMPLGNSRAYLLSQYWIDLKYATFDAPQKLPEVGFVLNATRLGSFLVSADATAANFLRGEGISAWRYAARPAVLHSAGKDVVLTQLVALRATAYEFYGATAPGNFSRLAFEYDGTIHSRFLRQYDSFTHVVEPTVRYRSLSDSPLDRRYVFDEWELHGKTSRLELSLLNRIIVKGSEVMTARITQPLDLEHHAKTLSPLELELATRKPADVKVSAAFDPNKGAVRSVTSDIRIPFSGGIVNFGQHYSVPENILVFKTGFAVQPVKPIQIGMDVRYDAKGEGIREVHAYVQYASQCWGARIEAAKKPGDFSVQVMLQLFGLTAKPPRDL